MIFHGDDDSRELEGNTWNKRNPRREISRNFPIDNPSSNMIFHGDDDSRELEGNTWSKRNPRREISRVASMSGARRERERERETEKEKNGEILYILWNEAARSV